MLLEPRYYLIDAPTAGTCSHCGVTHPSRWGVVAINLTRGVFCTVRCARAWLGER